MFNGLEIACDRSTLYRLEIAWQTWKIECPLMQSLSYFSFIFTITRTEKATLASSANYSHPSTQPPPSLPPNRPPPTHTSTRARTEYFQLFNLIAFVVSILSSTSDFHDIDIVKLHHTVSACGTLIRLLHCHPISWSSPLILQGGINHCTLFPFNQYLRCILKNALILSVSRFLSRVRNSL